MRKVWYRMYVNENYKKENELVFIYKGKIFFLDNICEKFDIKKYLKGKDVLTVAVTHETEEYGFVIPLEEFEYLTELDSLENTKHPKSLLKIIKLIKKEDHSYSSKRVEIKYFKETTGYKYAMKPINYLVEKLKKEK